MKVQEMHYEIKRRINKVDSNQNRNLLVPEIDVALNEAQMLFIKTVAEPRASYHLGVETTQRNIDDLRTIIVHDLPCNIDTLNNEKGVTLYNTAILPEDYLYFLRGYVLMKKGSCSDVKARLYIQRHNDLYEESIFTKSSFEWRTINGIYGDKTVEEDNPDYDPSCTGPNCEPETIMVTHRGIQLSKLSGVTYTELLLSYIRRPKLIYYKSGFNGGKGYYLPSGVYPNTDDPQLSPNDPLNADQDCELPESTHSEVVDIAAMIITGDLASPDYQYKMAKIKFNELK